MTRLTALLVLAIGAVMLTAACSGDDDNSPQASLPTPSPTRAAGIAPTTTPVPTLPPANAPPPALDTGNGPWPAPTNATARIIAAGLPPLPNEELAYHEHAHLDVIVNGQAMVVPANIGIDFAQRLISPLHTHDATGIIHIEAASPATFTLGQFFIEWGVRLDQACVGGYCAPGTPVKWYVNGMEYSGDPAKIELVRRMEVAAMIGTPPATIPNAYDFPAGY